MVRCIYKFLGKVLPCRLRLALKEVIGENQGAFVEEIHFLDSVLITNEVIHLSKKERGIERREGRGGEGHGREREREIYF